MQAMIELKLPSGIDAARFIAAARRSRLLHDHWTKAPRTRTEYDAYITVMRRPENRAFLVQNRQTKELVGVINLSNMVLGSFRSGYLGYYAFAGFERQGLMREGLRAVIRCAFTRLGLHRLEANIQPGNKPSIALVKSCGFSKEGYSPSYLKVAGRWRDHERWVILSS